MQVRFAPLPHPTSRLPRTVIPKRGKAGLQKWKYCCYDNTSKWLEILKLAAKLLFQEACALGVRVRKRGKLISSAFHWSRSLNPFMSSELVLHSPTSSRLCQSLHFQIYKQFLNNYCRYGKPSRQSFPTHHWMLETLGSDR